MSRGDPGWRQALSSRQGWGLALCQAAIFPAQPVATPHEAPRAGVIVRVPIATEGALLKREEPQRALAQRGTPYPPHPHPVHRQKAWLPSPQLSACSAVTF